MTEADDRALVLQQLDGQWQKIAAMLVWKLLQSSDRNERKDSVTITHKDLEAFQQYMDEGDKQFLTWGHVDSFEFRLMPRAEAERLAAHVEGMGGKRETPP